MMNLEFSGFQKVPRERNFPATKRTHVLLPNITTTSKYHNQLGSSLKARFPNMSN